MQSIFLPLIVVFAALAVYAIIAVLKRETHSSPQDEIDAARAEERRMAHIAVHSREPGGAPSLGHTADSDLLPSHAEAMIVPLGLPIEREYATFEGALSDVRARIEQLPTAERDHLAIWTPGHIFTANELLSEPRGHEHDPIAPNLDRQQGPALVSQKSIR